jgi:hypothetical protein
MPIRLYDAVIPSQLQILGSIARLVGKAEAYCAERGWPEAEIVEARLAPDMLPFAYQVKSAALHSLGAIEGVRRGHFSPDRSPPPDSFQGLSARVGDTITALEAIDPDEMETFIGRDMRFVFGEHHMDFTAENFLLSFSQPNFYFHAATAYDILRWKGMEIGKRDFNGRVRKKD